MADWWIASLKADLLALGLARTDPAPVSTFEAIDAKFRNFELTYLQLLEILKRENKTIDGIDSLTHPPLRQTLDEYDDFKYVSGAASFSKRQLGSPALKYKVARYVYNDTDIGQLQKKMDWQIRIMQETMDDMVLSYFIHVHKRSEVRPSENDHDSGSLGTTLQSPRMQQTRNEWRPRPDDDDENILHLWERVDRLSNRLTRTSPHVQSRIESNDAPPRLSPLEIARVLQPLKARFQKTAESARFIELLDEKQLAEYSQERLKRLLAALPTFTTRKRVYFNGESGENSPRNVATVKINPTKYVFALVTVDVVSSNRRKFIVCNAVDRESRRIGVLHHLPRYPVIYPSTNHRQVVSSAHDTEVSVEDECLVQVTGGIKGPVPDALPLYNFPLRPDMLAFQCALRDKLIRHTFDIDSIHSSRNRLETSHQHLKLWSDFNDENHTLSFYAKKENEPGRHLEFPVACFESKPGPRQDNPLFVRIYFRLGPNNHGVMRNIKQRMSFSKPLQNSPETPMPQSSSRRKFSWHRQTLESPLSQSPPTVKSSRRAVSSSGSLDSQMTIDTATDSTAYTTAAEDSMVHADADKMRYLDIKFSSMTDAGSFNVEFARAAKKRMKTIHFRDGSIFDGSRLPSPALEPGRYDDILIESPRTFKSTEAGKLLPPVPILKELDPPAVNVRSGNNAGLGILYDSPNPTIHEENMIKAYVSTVTNPPRAPLTEEEHFKKFVMTSNLVYRVQGIPIKYQLDYIKKLFRSKFELSPLTNIDIRSLAVSQDQRKWLVVVSFSSATSVSSVIENDWSFKWYLENEEAVHIKFDTHFIGLTMLYTPKMAEPEIDICAVSGLGGHAFGSFKEKGKGGAYMWVLDLLKEYFPRARIMTYGFNTKLDGSTSNSGLKTLARGLMDSLHDLGENTKAQASTEADDEVENLPLIFIGHSLGGLVVKQTMIDAENQAEYNNFFESVYGALFFGVPSQGMETAALETAVKDQANLPLVINLRKDVQALTEQSTKFNSVIRRQGLHMEYFYETKESPQLGKDPKDGQWKAIGETILMVSESSATNNMLSFEEYRQYIHPIERNHSELVKWKAHDPECAIVYRVLGRMKESALAKRGDAISSPLVGGYSFSLPKRQGTGFAPPMRVRTGIVMTPSPTSTKDYHVGWICAVQTEYVVASELLDEEYTCPSDLSIRDDNAYTFGRIGDHYVVAACLAKGKYGLTSAASVAKDMLRSFPAIRIGLMVGIGGGAPSKKGDIRLGDVVVSTPVGQKGGVIHCDFGKATQNLPFEYAGSLNAPPSVLLNALQKLSTLHVRRGHQIRSTIDNMVQTNKRLQKIYQRPDPQNDVLYKSSFSHLNNDLSCMELCIQETDQIVPRPDRGPNEDNPAVHYGLIASADRLMKDAHVRDHLAESEGVLCFEMEAAGLMDRFPCVVIRGICDYSDTHKNDEWQGYAAATAAAYAKELLGVIPGNQISQEAAMAEASI